MQRTIAFELNGSPCELAVDPDRPLLWVLRVDLGLTGTKYGCGAALCGACTVLVDGVATRSCALEVGSVAGKAVTTIEGLARGGRLHPVQQAFVEHDALQCGYCSPGMILSACSLLAENPAPTREQIIAHLDGNLCRCGSHGRILEAVEAASRRMRGGRR